MVFWSATLQIFTQIFRELYSHLFPGLSFLGPSMCMPELNLLDINYHFIFLSIRIKCLKIGIFICFIHWCVFSALNSVWDICAYVHTHVHTHTNAYTHTHKCTYIQKHIHVHTHTHTHTHTHRMP
jgi:hypothetical protein